MNNSISVTPDAVLNFWFDEITPAQHFKPDPELDRVIVERFGAARDQAAAGQLEEWTHDAHGTLALIILLDQFSRNIFRGDARAFEADEMALNLAKQAIAAGHDQQVDDKQRSSFYLPFMHSENLADQNQCVALFRQLPNNSNSVHHAEKHREVIEKFGRFPYRNQALGRTNTKAEDEYLAGGGYVP